MSLKNDFFKSFFENENSKLRKLRIKKGITKKIWLDKLSIVVNDIYYLKMYNPNSFLKKIIISYMFETDVKFRFKLMYKTGKLDNSIKKFAKCQTNII